MATKWSRNSSRLSSKSIGRSDGPRRPFERRASLPDASQLSSMVKSTEIRRSSSFANAEGSSKAKCVSALDGDKTLWTRLTRFSKGNKHGGRDKSPQSSTSTREAIETDYEERSGECYSSQVNVSKSSLVNGIKYVLRPQRHSIGSDIAVAYKCSAEEKVTFSFLKSVIMAAPTLESSMSPNQGYQRYEVFGGLTAKDNGNILIAQHSEDINGMNNTGRMREEKIEFVYKAVTDMHIRSYIEQEQISVHDGDRSPVRLVSPQLEGACDATRQHCGNTEMLEAKMSESASISCHDKVQCFDAVAAEPLRIQQDARKPCMHDGSSVSGTPSLSNKIQPIALPINKSIERAMAPNHCCITGEILQTQLPRKNCFFQTDVKKRVSNVIAGVSVKHCADDTSELFIPDAKENVSNIAKETSESTAKSNEAPDQNYSEQLLHSGTFLIHDSQKEAAIQSSFLHVPEAYIKGSPESNSENQHRHVKGGTECLAAINGQNPGASSVAEDLAIIRYPVVEDAESSTQTPAPDLAARAASCNTRKSATVVAPLSSLGAGAGARHKSGTARVRARTKACIKETKRLVDPRDPRTRDTLRMSVHLRPSDAESSVQIGFPRHESCLFPFPDLSEREKMFIEASQQTCASTNKCVIAMEEIKRYSQERTESGITEVNESCTLKIRELEHAHCIQLAADSWSCDGLISSDSLYEFGMEKSRNSASESFQSLDQAQGQGKIIDTVEKHRSVRLDSTEQMRQAWKQEEEEKRKSLLLQYKATDELTAYDEAVYNQDEGDFHSQFKEDFAFQTAQESSHALLRTREDEMRHLEAAALRLEQKEKEFERRKAEVEEFEAIIGDLNQRLDREDDAIDQWVAEVAMIVEEALQGMEGQPPEGG